MANLIISDIDGVIANCEHRLWYAKEKFYDSFYERVGGDSVIEDGVELLRQLTKDSNSMLIFLSGRRESCREDTKQWLKQNFYYPYEALYMRDDGDHRPAPTVKAERYAEIVRMIQSRGLSFEHVYYIDDDPKNIEAICKGDEHVTGLLFGIKRIDEEENGERKD